MDELFDHIEQVRFIFIQMLDSGFLSARLDLAGLGESREAAAELGLEKGSELLGKLIGCAAAFTAGLKPASEAALAFSGAVRYYELLRKALIVKNINASGFPALESSESI
ncbi:MAG: hypothetical protein LBU32_04615 [Clostridiales bacterium]|jgi:hypothetical protein|nr:hypothetical protein [Clostridiales bacterium]